MYDLFNTGRGLRARARATLQIFCEFMRYIYHTRMCKRSYPVAILQKKESILQQKRRIDSLMRSPFYKRALAPSYSVMRSLRFLSALWKAISSMPSPLYQCRKALRLYICPKRLANSLNAFAIPELLDTEVAWATLLLGFARNNTSVLRLDGLLMLGFLRAVVTSDFDTRPRKMAA